MLEAKGFEDLGIPVPSHDKLPDIVLHDEEQNWLFLIEFVSEIAWETEVWIAEMPDHLIHFNGDRFLGPHK